MPRKAKEKGVKVPKATPVDKQIRGEVKPIDVPIVVAMSSELTNRLPYPQDRWRGYVLLHDGNNLPYVTDFTRGGATALGYCQAVMEFMRRIGTPNPFRKASE